MPDLDELVFAMDERLAAEGFGQPAVLYQLATGSGLLAGRLERARSFPMAQLEGTPLRWLDAILHGGDLAGEPVWIVEAADEEARGSEPAWASGLPCWLAAAAGARVLVHAAAGSSLPPAPGGGSGGPPVGSLALLSDHLNLSGSSPLVGLSESRLGPLFPDLTHLHDATLRRHALAEAARLGLAAHEVVAACTAGPSLETPAERRWYAAAGAEVSVQGLAGPLLAAAHAGLATLAVVAAIDAGERPADLARIACAADAIAPGLDDLLVAVVGPAAERARRGAVRQD